jgi:ribosome-associated translation inhibitor RaiA
MQQISETEIQIPTQFSHSVKIEQTAKGARITVHVNANEALEAMEQSVNLYRATKLQLEQLKEVVAPVEIKA